MGVWFAILALAGLREVVQHPGILRALSPTYGASFLVRARQRRVHRARLGRADGHRRRGALRRHGPLRAPARSAARGSPLVFPALILNYMGQGALILRTPRAIDNPFFLLFPHWARIPMVVLATVATVIASQAVISGAFSVTRQAVQLGLPAAPDHPPHLARGGRPGLRARPSTGASSSRSSRSSSASAPRQQLASAYGIAVTGTLAIDTILFFVVVRDLWRKPLWLVIAGAGAVPDRRPDLLRRQPDQGPARRLVPALDRARRLRRADHLAARPRDRHAQPHRGGGPAARRSSTRSATMRPAGLPRRRAPASSSTPTSRRRRWRCARTSSTTSVAPRVRRDRLGRDAHASRTSPRPSA